jgi:hypothetical protein
MNLPPGTQEGLLQQTLEKFAKISRIEVFAKKNEGIVELSSVSVGFLELSGVTRTMFYATHTGSGQAVVDP